MLLYIQAEKDQNVVSSWLMIERNEAIDELSKANTRTIIDAHTHCGVDNLNIIKRRYPSCQSVIDLVTKLKISGVEYAVTFPCPSSSYYFDFVELSGEKVKLIERPAEGFPYEFANRQLFYEISLFGENRIFPFAGIFPCVQEERQIEFLENYSKKGVIFGLKLHTLATHTPATSLIGSPIMQYVEHYSLPILFHSGPDKFSGPENVLELAKKYPYVRMAIAHAGRFEQAVYDEFSTGKYPNVFFDTSPFISVCIITTLDIKQGTYGSKLDLRYDSPKQALVQLASVVPNNLVWGTDEPWTTITDDRRGEILSKVVYKDESDLLSTLPENIRVAISNVNTRRFLFGQ